MSSSIIQVKQLSKSFVINHNGKEQYTALRDVVSNNAKKIFSFPFFMRPQEQKSTKEIFWALKDVDFEVQRGDRLGIIGRNGAGKSTLLKILSRITEPTSGSVSIKGRVASLLEVGTGFHPELTGRENIFLNGAILGMNRQEIKKKFDEIVAFAEVDTFLDTPVKRYSSGMYVRLAFAVAAHLEPEILIVDEVLAVGDAQFQKKCLGKMEDVSRNEGRTILFVSHNMSAVKSICNTAIMLNKGTKIFQGDVYETLVQYMSASGVDDKVGHFFERDKLPFGKKIFLQQVEFHENNEIEYFSIQLKIVVVSALPSKIALNIRLKDSMKFPVAVGFTLYQYPDLHQLNQGENTIVLKTGKLSLAVGSYSVSLELVVPGAEHLDVVEDCLSFEVSNDTGSKRHHGILQNWGFGSTEIEFDDVHVGDKLL